MGVTAMGMDVVSEDSGHQVVPLAPNMCITPAAPSPLPLPYPITGSSSSLDPGTEKTQIGGKKVMNAACKVKEMHGNEAGTQKDIITFTTGGHAWPLPVPAVTIHFEGQPVTITGNPGFGNSQ
jgi:hypothetical protein